MVTLQLCSIGEYQDFVCHETFHTRGKIGLIQANEVSKENIELVIWRTGIYMTSLNTICLYHHNQYLDKFTMLNKFRHYELIVFFRTYHIWLHGP